MTRQYLIGEMSLMLGELQDTARTDASARVIAQLRHEAETGPIAALASVAIRSLELIDTLCREALDRGDAARFACQSTIGAELRDFAICAGLLDEAPYRATSAIR
jgi:hypothetical protein